MCLAGLRRLMGKWFSRTRSRCCILVVSSRRSARPVTALAVTITIIGGVLWHWRKKKDLVPGPEVLGATDEMIVRFYSWVPLILGIHFAVPLMVLGVQGDLFSPNNELSLPWNLFYGAGGDWVRPEIFFMEALPGLRAWDWVCSGWWEFCGGDRAGVGEFDLPWRGGFFLLHGARAFCH